MHEEGGWRGGGWGVEEEKAKNSEEGRGSGGRVSSLSRVTFTVRGLNVASSRGEPEHLCSCTDLDFTRETVGQLWSTEQRRRG